MIFRSAKVRLYIELQQKVKTKKYDCVNNHWFLKAYET